MQKHQIARGSCPASFRDPAGFIFKHDGQFFRHISTAAAADYDLLMSSGVYEALIEGEKIVRHEDVTEFFDRQPDTYKIIKPTQIPFISYPYEWSFNQLKDAALLTLDIQKTALSTGLSLKDASAYNIQFLGCKPVFIDTLSFERQETGAPWVAYRQFCQHFVAPLTLMSKVDIRLSQMLRSFIDGIPLDLASTLLPKATFLSPAIAIHIHAHARAQSKFQETTSKAAAAKSTANINLSKNALFGILDSLRGLIEDLKWNDHNTEWGDYYNQTNYNPASFQSKEKLVAGFFGRVPGSPKLVIDLGGNNGHFSRVLLGSGHLAGDGMIIAADIDPTAVDQNYQKGRNERTAKILPMLIDLTNPSPDIGWSNTERDNFLHRKRPDCVMALALLHHLVIGNNVPLNDVAKALSGMSPWVIIEFVGKADSQSQRLLSCRKDIFPDYTRAGFERIFSDYFEIVASEGNGEMDRQLYLLKSKA